MIPQPLPPALLVLEHLSMTKRMLIDAAHREETRVVVADGSQIDDFDFESEAKKQIKGNIYLARVTRVEPSLQAAFVEYGGNRHGFLAFSEIHPDYYQIPVADRERLLAMEAEAEARRAEAEDEEEEEEDQDDLTSEASDDADDTEDDGDDASDDEDDDDDTSDDEADDEGDEHSEAGSEDDSDDDSDDDIDDDDQEPVATLAAKPAKTRASETVETDAEEGDEESSEDDPDQEDGDEAASEGDDENDDATAAAEDDEDGEAKPASEEEEGSDNNRRRRGRRGGGRRQSRGGRSSGRDNGRGGDKGRGNGRRRGGGSSRRRGGNGEDDEDLSRDPRPFFKNYKIQEVIRRRQVLLVQVAKEERGNKGAALTTYLSLPGRYCVLMPNTARGGGISRKITNISDRKRLKSIVSELDVPKGMGLIVRTAGANRTKAEIKRDYDYLIRLWEEIRGLTLKSSAPSMIYEEGNLIKRSIRDLYSKDIEEVLIEGKEAYTEAKAFMKMLMPSHARNVKLYTERMPLYQRYHVDLQLDSMLSPRVDLPSGGYIIINQTEALVSVDVNSGKSTREHNIEQTALKTNLEAATELARQLRLRDLAGLIVIDFIDMEENRHNRAVERELKTCLEQDRARLQVGRISNFGLLEMSRQRLRAGILEGSTRPCPHCEGAGIVRSVESAALRILRACGEEGVRERSASVTVRTNRETAEFILNYKRRPLLEFEDFYGMKTIINVDLDLTGDDFEIDRGEPLSESRRQELHENETVSLDTAYLNEDDEESEAAPAEVGTDDAEDAVADEEEDKAAEAKSGTKPEGDDDDKPRRRRRGRRGGRRNRRRRERSDEQGEAGENASGNGSTNATNDSPAKERALEPASAGAPRSRGPEAGPGDRLEGDDKKGWWQRRWF